MISGRGLGHSGGTLDKFDSIPGYNTAPDRDAFVRVVKEVGVAIIGQTADLAPADRRIYAIRDVTATVESLPLITASILSKKLAAGLRGLAMDVKFGSGAFMVKYEDALALAESIAEVAAGAGVLHRGAAHRHGSGARRRGRQCPRNRRVRSIFSPASCASRAWPR